MTREQKIAALAEALSKNSAASEAERFLIMTEVLAEISDVAPPAALFLLQAAPMTDAQKATNEELRKKTLAHVVDVICPG